jgi:diphthamide synthase subunit DPH2
MAGMTRGNEMKKETQAIQYARRFKKDELVKKLEINRSNLVNQVGTIGEAPIRRHIEVIKAALEKRGNNARV